MAANQNPICPATGGDCKDRWACEKALLCQRLLLAPLHSLHFVGFTDPQRYANALRVFGPPDFAHRTWDYRAKVEIVDGDVAVFATEVKRKCARLNSKGECPYSGACWDCVATLKYDPASAPSPYSWDDSNQPDDPAAKERT